MCIRDRYQRRVRGKGSLAMAPGGVGAILTMVACTAATECLAPLVSGAIPALSASPRVMLVPGFLSATEAEMLAHAASGRFQKSATSMANHETISHLLDSVFDDDETMAIAGFREALAEELDVPGLTDGDVRRLLLAIGEEDGSEVRLVALETALPEVREWLGAVKHSPEHTHKHTRRSETAWLGSELWPRSVVSKLSALLALPEDAIISNQEPLQVVRYLPKEQYRCHHDSTLWEDAEHSPAEVARQRVLTALMVLKAPESGGSTWFPYATNWTGTPELRDWDHLERKCRVNASCQGGLVVPLEAGSLVVWLNHRPEGSGRGFEAQLDFSTLHSGCLVEEGQKIIGNFWLTRGTLEKYCRARSKDRDL
eukprot:TRINITY_DN6618_c0_g1_i15.p1 TRINITY_DN6618_c0_g1~~TRINITY_DN6618_c0_g1_i15.p1  ORF type:complete len:369 (+),score=84.33 TRINITY_DN6618_c0_g1_i15:166-1272(+)